MKLRRMGNTGLQVSDLCLGTMNFGMPDWGIEEKPSIEVIHAYLEAGGNFIDTADVYGGGASEKICAKAIKGNRDKLVLATKGHFPVTRTFGEPPVHPNALGSSRRHLTEALDDSLRRLGTDYVDLYQMHCWDGLMPIEETLSTLDSFVKSGKVRHIGLSNYTPWQIVEARHLCIRFNWEPFVTAQMQYSLICRDVERAVIPVCERYQIGLLPWSPLGGGVLTGKYGADLKGPKESRYGDEVKPDDQWRSRFLNERNLGIAEAVRAVAAEIDTTPTAIAIAWLLTRPTVSSVITGPKSVAQLRDNLAGSDLTLSDDQLQRLAKASEPVQTYPEWFIDHTRRNQS